MQSAPAGEFSITADREETKYLVARTHQRVLVAALDEHLPSHHYRGDGENPLPGPEHFVTTVYFDTPSRLHYRAARDGDDSVKLRAKEYYDVHPSLAELATDVSQVLHQTSFLWLELKRRAGSRTSKRRVRIPRSTVPSWLSGRPLGEATQGGDSEAISAYCAGLPEPLLAHCVVNYRRRSWQAADGTLRVTLDAELSFFAPPERPWSMPSLARGELGSPRARENSLLLEIKRRDVVLPTWLEQALRESRARAVTYSKFLRAAQSVCLDD